MAELENIWYKGLDCFSPHIYLAFKLKEVIFRERSPYQLIEVVDTYTFGKALLLDGFIMFTEKDEMAYHEMLVHPAMVVHPAPKKILIIGGGDGGAIREILKYKEVEKITLVDIDAKVIEVSKKYFPEISKGFDDQRVEVVNTDGSQYVKAQAEKIDIMFIDSTDPTGPGKCLAEEEFLETAVHNLKPDIWVAQTESPFFGRDFIKEYTNKLKKLFKNVKVYLTSVPSYGGAWTFTFGANGIDAFTPCRQPPEDLLYYTPDVHNACFQLPSALKSLLEE